MTSSNIVETIRAQSPNLGVATNSITVPAIAYMSGGRLWYAATVPYKTLGKFVQTSAVKKKNQEIIQSEIRNRFLDKTHKDDIKNYIEEERAFTIPPVTLVSFEELSFQPFVFDDQKHITSKEEFKNNMETYGSMAGIMFIPIDYEFECLDGNHRTVAIRELAEENPSLIAGSNMLLNIVCEKNPRKIRQDFVDVNKNAKQTSPSINTLFNTRDPLSGLVAELLEDSDYLNSVTELMATSISKNSKDIYTLNNIKNAVIELGGKDTQAGSASEKFISNKLKSDEEFKTNLKENAIEFFKKLKQNSYVQDCITNRDKASEFRNKSVITSGVGLIVASRVAGYIFNNFNETQALIEIDRLMSFDWSRNNPVLIGRMVNSDQKLYTSRDALKTTAETIITELGYVSEEATRV